MPSFAERRQMNTAREVRWIRRHPNVSRGLLWFLVVAVVGEIVMAAFHVSIGRWVLGAFYALAAGCIAWIARRWAGQLREAAQLPND